MQILSVDLHNFASYKTLQFQFDGVGLALIQGPTGSGKSTLCDAIPWVLFGRTAKGGGVDEVLSWPHYGICEGEIKIENSNILGVVRKRSKKPKDNDLWFYTIENGSVVDKRGKDITDTQRLINMHLGMDCDLYLSGAYFHEFSQAASFFTTTAKNRRAICEQIVDLSKAKTIQVFLGELAKSIKRQAAAKEQAKETSMTMIKKLKSLREGVSAHSRTWVRGHKLTISSLKHKSENFEKLAIEEQKEAEEQNFKALRNIEAEINKLQTRADIHLASIVSTYYTNDAICSECGAYKADHQKALEMNAEHRSAVLLLEERVKNLKDKKSAVCTKVSKNDNNIYAEQLEEAKKEVNPYIDSEVDLISQAAEEHETCTKISTTLQHLKEEAVDVDLMLQVIATFRSTKVSNATTMLQENTNRLLTTHFDGEIKVVFEVESADTLDVTIFKDGNRCVYSQLSKGQRQLLKLCFGVSIMRCIANHNGLEFNSVFLDEALDGLSDTLKIKAYGLLQELAKEYDNVLVVEHSSELKALFDKQYIVELVDGSSIINDKT